MYNRLSIINKIDQKNEKQFVTFNSNIFLIPANNEPNCRRERKCISVTFNIDTNRCNPWFCVTAALLCCRWLDDIALEVGGKLVPCPHPPLVRRPAAEYRALSLMHLTFMHTPTVYIARQKRYTVGYSLLFSASSPRPPALALLRIFIADETRRHSAGSQEVGAASGYCVPKQQIPIGLPTCYVSPIE